MMLLRTRPAPLKATALALLLGTSLQLAALPAHAAIFGDDEARQAVLNLRTKVDGLQRDFSRQLNELSRKQNDIDSLRQEVAQLRGQLEDALNQLQEAQKNQQTASADIDSRLKRFEPVEVTVDGRKFTVEQAEKREFDEALGLFRKSSFKAADQAFAAFAKAHPESPYLPTALYWQGGAQYAQGSYKTAISTLQDLIKRFPDGPRTADALLLIGNAQSDAGNDRAARQTFTRITREFASSGAANAAKERLKGL